MKNFETNNFGTIHISPSNVKIVGSKDVLGEVLRLNRLTTQIATESKRKNFPKRKFGKDNFENNIF